MKTSHEWPQPPSTFKPSSSSRRKLTRDSLASADFYSARRYQSYSDGDDDSPTRAPLQAECQISGFASSGNCKGFQSSAYGKGKGIQISSGDAGNHEGFRHGADVAAMPSNATKIVSFNKEAKAKFSANRRVDHGSIAPQQARLRLNACPFSGALKVAGKLHTARHIVPAHAAREENTCFDTREPFSPEVTCLGRVRIKETQGHETENSHTEPQISKGPQKLAPESKKQSPKDVGTSNRSETAEKRSCLPRRKIRREHMELRTLNLFGTSSSTVEPNTTRRERAAVLARSLTSLLEDLRRLDMENSEYVPAVPPPNSLLLMRGFGIVNKSCNQEPSTLLNENACQSEESSNSTVNENSCKGNDIKMQKSTKLTMRTENSAVQSRVSMAQKVFPLSEIESNYLVQNASSSEINNKRPTGACQQELALWQRRAIAKLAAIEVKGPMRMDIKQPNTK